MRHGAITLAHDLGERVRRGEQWDLLLCSDMLSLAEFRGLAPESVRGLPSLVYFHENQLTYPVAGERLIDTSGSPSRPIGMTKSPASSTASPLRDGSCEPGLSRIGACSARRCAATTTRLEIRQAGGQARVRLP